MFDICPLNVHHPLQLLITTGGYVAACTKFLFDIVDQRRKAKEAQAKQGALIGPFIQELNTGEYLSMFEAIEKGCKNRDGTDADLYYLRGYPAKLEEIGAKMVSGELSPETVYKHFEHEILTTKEQSCLWQGEDMRYWKVFQALADGIENLKTQHVNAGRIRFR